MNCPKCGKIMEPGTLQIRMSANVFAGVRWIKEGEESGFAIARGRPLPIGWGYNRMAGFACESCHVILFYVQPEED